jgi:hypothetical protein
MPRLAMTSALRVWLTALISDSAVEVEMIVRMKVRVKVRVMVRVKVIVRMKVRVKVRVRDRMRMRERMRMRVRMRARARVRVRLMRLNERNATIMRAVSVVRCFVSLTVLLMSISQLILVL